MALPKRGDPRRPLFLAIRSTRLLGIVLILFGLLALIPMMLVRRTRLIPLIFLGVGLIYITPGILYLLCAIFMKQRKSWAIILALVVASLQLLFTLFSAAMIGFQSRINIIPLVIVLILFAALGQLIYHLSRSFEAIKYAPPEEQRGFEPMILQPIPPTEPPRQT